MRYWKRLQISYSISPGAVLQVAAVPRAGDHLNCSAPVIDDRAGKRSIAPFGQREEIIDQRDEDAARHHRPGVIALRPGREALLEGGVDPLADVPQPVYFVKELAGVCSCSPVCGKRASAMASLLACPSVALLSLVQ
jgi:hypothetical protein